MGNGAALRRQRSRPSSTLHFIRLADILGRQFPQTPLHDQLWLGQRHNGRMRVQEGRGLTDEERLLLERLLSHGTPESKGYAEQLPLVTVTSRCGCGCRKGFRLA
jgi:hypothetical protein